MTSGSTVIWDFNWNGKEAADEVTTINTTATTRATVSILDTDEVKIKFNDEFYAFVEGQTFKVTITPDDNDVKSFSESFEGVVEELEFGTFTESTNTFEVKGLDNEDDEVVKVFVNGSEITVDSHDGDELKDTTFVDGAYVKVLVLDKASDLVIKASDNIELEK